MECGDPGVDGLDVQVHAKLVEQRVDTETVIIQCQNMVDRLVKCMAHNQQSRGAVIPVPVRLNDFKHIQCSGHSHVHCCKG